MNAKISMISFDCDAKKGIHGSISRNERKWKGIFIHNARKVCSSVTCLLTKCHGLLNKDLMDSEMNV